MLEREAWLRKEVRLLGKRGGLVWCSVNVAMPWYVATSLLSGSIAFGDCFVPLSGDCWGSSGVKVKQGGPVTHFQA